MFQNLDKSIKELCKIEWIIMHKKPQYTAISLNTNFKKEILEFIEQQMPYLEGTLK